MSPCVIAVVGPSGSGKTLLIERLIPLLKKRGLKVGAVKHAHDRIDLDRPGKDSFRHLKAGAEGVAVVGPRQILHVEAAPGGDGLDRALKRLPEGLDLVFLEGFHKAAYPQIAVADRAGKLRHGERLMAIVSDKPSISSVRRFRSKEISELAGFIEEKGMKQ